ncbi:hypothetical protein [Caproiciproducens sp. MSJ-32]|uniref:hypothetical protein n=1 Tax=Caproiciproducens sp. MSJ-32 TaxID=2841527 RepID=UPI001C0F5443|nr:hypothetical protein [Caproiciproducens sp. MSJ-32]MBU5454138.1 hypothetical protein [Caproiciproducens sp. MSJ-32]
MLEIQPIEFFLRAIPEGFIYLLGVYVFSETKIDKERYVISSLIAAVAMFAIRFLPIVFGVHTILSILFIIILSIFYNKIDLISAIKGTIIHFIVQYLSEGINLVLLKYIFKLNFNLLLQDPISKSILGIPSLVLSLSFIFLYYKFFSRKDGFKNV